MSGILAGDLSYSYLQIRISIMENKKSDKKNLEKKRGLFLQIGLVMALSLVLVAFEWTTREATVMEIIDAPADKDFFIIQNTRQEDIKKQISRPQPVVLEIIPSTSEIEPEDNWEPIDVEATGETVIELKSIVIDNETEQGEEFEFFVIVEEMPQFGKGKKDEFLKFIKKNLKYPTPAERNKVEGTVYVSFIINEEGDVINVEIIKGVHPDLDSEAVRVIKSSPKWTPGKQREKAVKVKFAIPVRFLLR